MEAPDEKERRILPAGIREAGCIVALLVGAGAGWQASGQGDLLDAALRGGGVWLATLLLWLAGAAVSERLLGSAAAPAEGGAPSAAAEIADPAA